GQGTDDVEVGAAEEDGVGREKSGLDVQAFEAVEDAGVDGGLRGQGGWALKGWIEGALGASGDTGGGDGQEDREWRQTDMDGCIILQIQPWGWGEVLVL